MKKYVTVRLFKSFSRVNYYTFYVEGREQTEADAFFSRFETDEAFTEDINTLVTWLIEIGRHRGAKARYFRAENAADALPPPRNIVAQLTVADCSLRLYCVRVSEEIVILANGGVKESKAVQDSPDAYPKFLFANRMAKQVLQMLGQGELVLNGKNIVNLDEIELLD